MFLIIMGVFAKFAAALVSIPAPVLGGMTTFLFCAVAVSGMAIINRIPFNRRNRFILTASLAVGYGATLVPTWFSHVFTYKGNDTSLQGFLDAIELVMETGFAVTAFLAMFLNLTIGEEIEADAKELEGKHVHAEEESVVAPSESKAIEGDIEKVME
jgi:uric acid-xanthine permease